MGEDKSPWVTATWQTADPARLWAALRELLRADEPMARAAIVVCEGEHGWKDYLILHHFDPSVPRAELG